jgi:hypothetical protein
MSKNPQNPGWDDDLCDGPVRARVTFGEHVLIDAEPGYVTATPPNYAPGLFGVVTMDDVVREVFYDQGWLEQTPQRPAMGQSWTLRTSRYWFTTRRERSSRHRTVA